MAQQSPFRRGFKHGCPSVETPLIAMCCVCGLVRARKDTDQWVTKRSYEQMYGIKLVGSPLTHTYCSGCHADFLQRVRPSGQTPLHPAIPVH